jgi:hypothetical protein
VFGAVQAHWLTACLHVMLELHVADVLLQHTDSQQGMHIDEVRGTESAHCCGAQKDVMHKGPACHIVCAMVAKHASTLKLGPSFFASFSHLCAASQCPPHQLSTLLPCPLPCLQVAQACGASSPHLYKVLRVLAQHEMLDELPDKTFKPNDVTRELVQVSCSWTMATQLPGSR